MKKITIYFITLLFFVAATGQNTSSVIVNFSATFNNKEFQLDSVQNVLPNSNDSFTVTTFKFYVSNIVLLDNGKKVYTEKNSYHLVDFSDINSLSFKLNTIKKIKYNSIQFNLGIDSATNSKGALGKDLDPTKGMYWAWHSGYINFKIEGSSKLCKTRNNAFQFHLGGFLNGYLACKKVKLNINNSSAININFNTNVFFNKINIAETNEIMTPSKKAIELSNIAASCFEIKE